MFEIPSNLTEANEFIQRLPFSKALNMRVEEIGESRAVMTTPYDLQIIGNPSIGVIDGGVVTALMDTCGGLAVLTHPEVNTSMATLNLKVDYMRPANSGQQITAEAECYNVTRTVAFVRVMAFDEDRNRPVATALATYTLN
ncbi:MAG: PaaI family thioesterase [Rhodobacteraceae bacterium]|nr:PaaI family thioesterase [Paracoccaceae bacterium]